MNAIILAAGRGQRFQPELLAYPKCLLEFGGKTLLARSIAHLAWCGCQTVTVIVGYHAEMVEQELARLGSNLELDVLYNSNYHAGSVGSVLCAQDILQNKATLMLDADILYDRRILTRLLDAGHDNVILMEQKDESVQSEYWLFAHGERLTGVHRGIAKPPEAIGVYWGVHKFSPAFGKRFVSRAREMYRDNEATEYWYVVPALFSEMPVGYIDTAGLLYYEMDTWQEVTWAREHIFPQLAAAGQM